MARLIPKIAPQDISNVGERDIAIALVEQLPDECIVYHSYPWLRADRNDRTKKVTLREGEADFVIVHPKAGILILEVKGGEIHYDHEGRGWYRKEPHRIVEIKDPFEQARRNAHTLEREIRRESFRGQDKIPCPYGYAVAFPHCDYSGGVPPGADTSMIFSASDLERLGQRVTKLLGNWKRGTAPVNLSKEQMTGIQLALSPAFQLLPVLFRKVQEQEDRLHRLTEDQVRLLEFLGAHERAAIKGVAGSGKTILANAQAQKFAREGKKTLLVCFNKSLAEWLEQSKPDEFKDTIKVDTFHGLCSEFCRKAHIPFVPKWNDSGEFWLYMIRIVKPIVDSGSMAEWMGTAPIWASFPVLVITGSVGILTALCFRFWWIGALVFMFGWAGVFVRPARFAFIWMVFNQSSRGAAIAGWKRTKGAFAGSVIHTGLVMIPLFLAVGLILE
ncbi:MAG: NERD domain-containing protein, partial [Planctomycetes bacterium]|nr:NERD domain-containing protein [Planctomycetota bacterium]